MLYMMQLNDDIDINTIVDLDFHNFDDEIQNTHYYKRGIIFSYFKSIHYNALRSYFQKNFGYQCLRAHNGI